jgi:hypothetical protein
MPNLFPPVICTSWRYYKVLADRGVGDSVNKLDAAVLPTKVSEVRIAARGADKEDQAAAQATM